MNNINKPRIKKPDWLKIRLPTAPQYEEVRLLLKDANINTVCQEARCPNQWECFAKKTATFLILGKTCTRNCAFCAVDKGLPLKPDKNEAKKVTQATLALGLNYVVVTSVTRDDLADGGAAHFATVIREMRQKSKAVIEVLIPDFQGDTKALQTVIAAKPDVISHNIETVPRLYPTVRPQANYKQSLKLLAKISQYAPEIQTKSGLMLGLGEKDYEVKDVLQDLYQTGCRSLTIGQYLQPSPKQLPVKRYVPPAEFKAWQDTALTIGFKKVASAPFVRSSYKAAELQC